MFVKYSQANKNVNEMILKEEDETRSRCLLF